MKKTAIIIGFGLMLLASCTKDYTCQCTFTDSTPTTPLDDEVSETVITGKKNDVRTTCERGSEVSGYYATTCVIK